LSKLDKKGEEITIPKEPENVVDYEVSTFVSTMRESEHNVVYKTSERQDGTYDVITVYQRGEELLIRVENLTSSYANLISFYYIADGVTYVLSPNENTYQVYEGEGLNKSFINLDYSKDRANVTEDAYFYGDNASGVIIRTQDDKVYSVTNSVSSNADVYLVVSYGEGRPNSAVFDISNMELK
jgi:hypothetical protein